MNRSILITGWTLLLIGTSCMAGWYWKTFVDLLGLPFPMMLVVRTVGAVVLGAVMGRFWLGLLYRAITGRWPGPLLRRFVRERMWRQLW